MSFVNRKLYKQKPQAWGPVSAVQASIFKNAEKVGIPIPDSFIPTWENAGYNVFDYLYNVNGTKQGNWGKSALTEIDSNSRVNVSIPSALEQGASNFAVFSFEFHGVIASNSENVYALWLQGAPGTQFSAIKYSYSTEKFSVYSYNGEFSTTGTYGDYTYDFPATHFVFTIDSNNNAISIYADGKLLEVFAGTCQWSQVGGSIYYGGKPGTLGIVRRLDYAKLWHNVILTPDQVAYSHDNPYFLMNRVPPVFYSVPGGAITIKTITDTGSGIDGIAQISNILSVSDSGSGFDVFAGFAAGISVVDVGSGTDAVQPAASVTVQDTGVAIELIQQISAACSVADTGTGADNIGRLLASLFVSDTGAGADIITVLKELLKTVTDSGTGTDSVSQLLATVSVGDTGSCTDTISQILADISVSDTGAGADFINLLKDILKTISDTGSGSDSVSIQPVSVSVYDAGIALDLIGHIAVALSVSDAGTIAEIISTIKTKMVTVTDIGTGSDSAPIISVSLTVSDTAAALDLVGQVINSLTVSDTGTGLESITKTDFDILPSGKVMVTFTIKTPGASFAMRTPKATFNIE